MFLSFTYAFQSEFKLWNVKFPECQGTLARSRRKIWSLSDFDWTRTHNHLVHKRTLNYLAKPFHKVFVYELSGCGFESSSTCHVDRFCTASEIKDGYGCPFVAKFNNCNYYLIQSFLLNAISFIYFVFIQCNLFYKLNLIIFYLFSALCFIYLMLSVLSIQCNLPLCDCLC